MRILIVDDDAATRALGLVTLREAGHKATALASGAEAAARVGEDWDMVVVDLSEPGDERRRELLSHVTARAELVPLPRPFSAVGLLEAVSARTEGLLGRFAGESVSRWMHSLGERPGHGKLMRATMLFADVRWFTPYAASVGPEEAVSALNVMLEIIVAEVAKQGGLVNKFLGDGALALFGAPDPALDQERRAALAALGIVKSIEALANQRVERGETPLRMGIGINTGEVVAGLLGSHERMEYTVIGHAANIASRLESISRPRQIFLGRETAHALGPEFAVKALGPRELPGVPGTVEIWELLA